MTREQRDFVDRNGLVAWFRGGSTYVDVSNGGLLVSMRCGWLGVGIITAQDIKTGFLEKLKASGYKRYPAKRFSNAELEAAEAEAERVRASPEYKKIHQESLCEDAISAFKASNWAEGMRICSQITVYDETLACWKAMCYAKGQGVSRDGNLALRILQQVISGRGANCAWAENFIGCMYDEGIGIPVDKTKACEYYEKAISLGERTSVSSLAWIYYDRDDVTKYKRAFDLFLQAPESDAHALCGLGLCYELGRGVAIDYPKALDCYRKAGMRGDSVAQCNAGLACEFGRGVDKNLSEAVKWYKMSADNGFARGMYRLGLCYQNGLGVEKNRAKALEWYLKAADLGYADAMAMLSQFEEIPDSVEIANAKDLASREGKVEFVKNAENTVDPMTELDKMIGLAPVKAEVKKMVDFIAMQKARAKRGLKATNVSYHCVFTGNPGTGKTTVARIIARSLKRLGVIKTDNFVETDRSGLVAEYIGQTAMKTNQVIDKAIDGVLFIDEAYSLAKGGDRDYGREAVDALLKRMEDDRDRLVVIIAGYTEPMQEFLDLNPGLRSRFTRYIDFPDYDAGELACIFKKIATSEQYKLGAGVEKAVYERMKGAVRHKDKNFGNGRFVRNFYDETVIRMASRFNSTGGDVQEIEIADLPDERLSAGARHDEAAPPVRIEDVLKELDQLTGLKCVKDEVRKIVDLMAVQKKRAESGLATTDVSNHMVFLGNPGTGKTTVARIVSKAFHALGILKTDKVVEADRSGLVAEYIGQTALKTNAIIDEAINGVLFIDEAYTLGNGGEKDFGREAIDTFLKRMEDDRDRLVVIVAGYTKEMRHFLSVNPGLESRFTRYIEFPDYSADELTEIFARMAKKNQYQLDAGVLGLVRDSMSFELGKRLKAFGNARFVRTFFEKALEMQSARVAAMERPSEEDLQKLVVADFQFFSPAAEKEETVEDVLKDLDELVGIDSVKREIRKLAGFFNIQKQRKSMGLPFSSASYHCVFSGSPGTGKTTVARLMARVYKALGVTKTSKLVEADRAGLVAEYIGQTALKTNTIIDEAINGVLFIDEAYTLANGGEKDFGREAIDTLLKRMEDDRDRLVVIIAGYTDEMKRFIAMNPGLESRFTRYIEFPDYSADELTEIFVRMATKELYRLSAEVVGLVRNKMRSLVANKGASFGNARACRTFYEQVKERQGLRLSAVGMPTKEQVIELLPGDVMDIVTATPAGNLNAKKVVEVQGGCPTAVGGLGQVIDCDGELQRERSGGERVLTGISTADGESELKVGKVVQAVFPVLFAEHRITQDDIDYLLSDLAYKYFKTGGFRVLKEVVNGVEADAVDGKGVKRFYTKFVLPFNGKQYIVTSQLFRKGLENILAWIEQHGISIERVINLCGGRAPVAAVSSLPVVSQSASSERVQQTPNAIRRHLDISFPAEGDALPTSRSVYPLTEAALQNVRCPIALVVEGNELRRVTSWQDCYLSLLERLNELDGIRFGDIPAQSAFKRFFFRDVPHMRYADCYPVKFGANGDVRAKVISSKSFFYMPNYVVFELLRYYGINPRNVAIRA